MEKGGVNHNGLSSVQTKVSSVQTKVSTRHHVVPKIDRSIDIDHFCNSKIDVLVQRYVTIRHV